MRTAALFPGSTWVLLLILLASPHLSADTLYWEDFDNCTGSTSPVQSFLSRQENKYQACLEDNEQCLKTFETVDSPHCPGSLMGIYRVYVAETCEIWSVEGGANAECGTCPAGYIDAGEDVLPRCQLPETPEECLENGEYYEQGGYCVPECKSGSALDHMCLEPPEDQCSAGSDDFIGTIGYGANQHPVCGDNSCPDGGTFGFEQKNGAYTATCFPPDANPPQCPGGSALIVGEGGYAFECQGLDNRPGQDEDEQDSDGDSDGDGEGDLTGITNQLDDIKKLLKSGNTERSNLKSKLDTINKTIGDGVNTLKDAIGNIPGGGGGNGNGDGEGESEDPITWTGEPIDTELTAADEEYEAVMQEYQDTLNKLKTEVQNMFGANLSGGGSVPDDVKQIKGVDVNFSLNRFLGGFEILPALILFIAAFISLGIITSGRG
ncbi:hypothetical protein [Marinobacter sp. NFXS9]|uniref:hypothetical protein n=1 Tax=Marinobacter sp. NFXS9 TaxID=2818433 RepID=UPI0032DFDBC1